MSGDESGSAFETVVFEMRAYIQEEGLAPGDVLPPERELAQRFKVARHTLREAIRVLQEKGVLASRRGSGTYIMPGSEAELAAALASCVTTEKDRLFEIFQFREIVEPQIAALAAEMATPEHIAKLNGLIESQDNLSNSGDGGKIDSQFHIALAHTTGNKILADIVEKINEALAPARSTHHISPERRKRSVAGHRVIVDAIESGHADKAREAMTEHVAAIKRTVLKSTS